MKSEVRCTVNGVACALAVHPMTRLLDALREDAQLTGTKEGCGEGECGACTVLMNGRIVNSCLVPALQAEGATITTVEGLAKGDVLHAVQRAFITHGGAQCGMCTPGMIIATVDLLGRVKQPDEAQIREGLAGNICRCTGYIKIFDAVREASRLLAENA